jgi:hypothetical protein
MIAGIGGIGRDVARGQQDIMPSDFGVVTRNRTEERMTPAQCKAARALASLDSRELAARATVSPDLHARFERGEKLGRRPEIGPRSGWH